jgi:hypothetical protein
MVATKLENFGFRGLDHPSAEFAEQLRWRVVAVNRQEPGEASIEVEHARLLLRCDDEHRGFLRVVRGRG